MKKVIAGILTGLAAVLCVMIAACSASFVGEYKFSSMSMDEGGISINYEVGKEYMGVTFKEDVLVLTVNSDNTWTMATKMFGESQTQSGTWEEKDGKYYLSVEGESEQIEVTLEGNKITFEQEGAKVVLKK